MPILSALYIQEEKKTEMTPQQLEVHLYEVKYKGNLFCTTVGCRARIVYVHKAASASYFRTWKHDNHADHCLYKFNRERGRLGSRSDRVIHVEASPVKKGKALDEAFAIAKQSEDEKAVLRAARKVKKSPTTGGTEENAQVKLVLFDGVDEITLKNEGIRSPRILKRDAKALKDSDVGRVRLVYGIVSSVDHEALRARICIDGGNKTIQVRFEEAFFASNPMYEGLFHHAKRLCSEYQNVIFTGIGELRSGRNGDYELFIYQGQDFKLENSTLQTVATLYSTGLME